MKSSCLRLFFPVWGCIPGGIFKPGTLPGRVGSAVRDNGERDDDDKPLKFGPASPGPESNGEAIATVSFFPSPFTNEKKLMCSPEELVVVGGAHQRNTAAHPGVTSQRLTPSDTGGS